MSLQSKQIEPPENAVSATDIRSQEFENFIYLVSHDVRNSVRALLEVPQWIEEDLENAGVQIKGPLADNIELMNTHTRRLDRMLIDLLVYSRIGRMQNNGEVAWGDVIDLITDQINVPPGFRIIRDLQEPIIVMGENDVMTLVSSLISNAIKHHDNREGCVWIQTVSNSEYVSLTVVDDGPGIPIKSREKVFEVMTTLRPRDEVEGSGMGLAKVRKIVTFYGGDIEWLDTEGGRGTALRFRFPKQRPTRITH
ncbi:MAG: ATP-binding protein [Arenibacterium sp.]